MNLSLATPTSDAQDFIAEHIVAAKLDYPEASNCCLLRVAFTLDKDLPADAHAQVSLTYQLNGASIELMDHRLELQIGEQVRVPLHFDENLMLFTLKYAAVFENI